MRRRYGRWGGVLGLALLSVAAADRRGAPLVEAVKSADTEAVSALLQKKVDVNSPAVDGSTALHWAVHRNDLKMIDRLLRAGANVKVTNNYGVAPLTLAAENASAAMVERLLKAGADPNTTARGGETALMTAAGRGNAATVKVLVAHGANVNARESTREQTALMWAAARGNTAVVKTLIEMGADIQARSSELKAFFQGKYLAGSKAAASRERIAMFTPLLFAVRAGHIQAARALLEAGADVNDAGPDGMTALHIACLNGHWELGAMLVDKGADVRAESPGGTALHHIAQVRSAKVLVRSGGLAPPETTGNLSALDLVKKLVAAGADVNRRMTKPPVHYGVRSGQVGMTPLLMTAVPADPDYMRVLLDLGADPMITTINHTTFLMRAAGLGLSSLVGENDEAFTIVKTAVEELGLDVNAKNDDGDTALHGAAYRNYVPLLQYLVDHGAQLDAKNTIGWTPLMEARWSGRSGSVLTTRREAEAFLRKIYEAHGLPTFVTTREEAMERLFSSKGGPTISCPPSQTVKSEGGHGAVINYPPASASSGRKYTFSWAKVEVQCTPAIGSEFPVGVTTVTCTATDTYNRTDSCTVLMRVTP